MTLAERQALRSKHRPCQVVIGDGLFDCCQICGKNGKNSGPYYPCDVIGALNTLDAVLSRESVDKQIDGLEGTIAVPCDYSPEWVSGFRIGAQALADALLKESGL